MGVGMGLNLLLLLAMVATNILSLYHLLSTTRNPSATLRTNIIDHTPVPDHLLHQLHTIRATITQLTRSNSKPSADAAAPPPPPEDLLLYSRIAPIASACSDHPELLRRYMNYTPFRPCPPDSLSLAEPLILRGCHPLPRRRCFSPSRFARTQTEPKPDFTRLLSAGSALDLPVPQLLRLSPSPIRLALDIGGGAGALASLLRRLANATVLTTTMNLGYPYNEAVASQGLVPMHMPLQQRFPVHDGSLDLVRAGRAVNRWIPTPSLEFLLFDADRVLRPGGLLWMDHFFCRAGDLTGIYTPMIGRLGYKTIKWAVENKTDGGGVRFGEVYVTALLQKPPVLATKV
ncbi:putative methyltransferase type 11, S-adenosyl-L-methionine-dependent methyltransferase [Dioscorea sansibarensis]